MPTVWYCPRKIATVPAPLEYAGSSSHQVLGSAPSLQIAKTAARIAGPRNKPTKPNVSRPPKMPRKFQERQTGRHADQRRTDKMVGNEHDSRGKQEKQNRSAETGLSDECDAGDHVYKGRSERNCCKEAGRKPEQYYGMAHARDRVCNSKQCSLGQSDQYKTVDGSTHRDNSLPTEVLPRWTKQTICNDTGLIDNRWTVSIGEKER